VSGNRNEYGYLRDLWAPVARAARKVRAGRAGGVSGSGQRDRGAGGPEPIPGSRAPIPGPAPMDDLLQFILFFAGWIVLQRWILPKAGVPS